MGQGRGWAGGHPGEGDSQGRGSVGEECPGTGSIRTVSSRDEETPDCLGGAMATGEAGAEVREVLGRLHRAGP